VRLRRKSLITHQAKRIKADRGLQADGAWSVNLGTPGQISVGAYSVLERGGGNRGARLTAFPYYLEFELGTVKTSLGNFGASIARYGVHDLHRAHYLRNSTPAQDVLPGRIRLAVAIRYQGNWRLHVKLSSKQQDWPGTCARWLPG
jgi:hypothetical protein